MSSNILNTIHSCSKFGISFKGFFLKCKQIKIKKKWQWWLLHCYIWLRKNGSVSTKIFINKHNVFNIDNNNKYFWAQISILEGFRKDHLTLKTGVIAFLKISIAITGITYVFKYTNIVVLNFNILQHYYFYCIFDQVNAASVNVRDFFQKH